MLAWLALASALSLAGAPVRHAVVIAAPTGSADDAPLAFARDDATQMAAALRQVGDFAPGEVELVLQPTHAALSAVFARLSATMRPDDFLLVYYSGHGDAQGMHLASERVPWQELLTWTSQPQARARLLVVDACNSGALTTFKGSKTVAPFMPNIAEAAASQSLPQGLAILTSSGASEYSIESASFASSLFTHHLVAALVGAADRNNDGMVSLSEAFDYTTDRVGAGQSSNAHRHQHPSFRYSLRGEADLWLSHIHPQSAEGAVFQLSQAGTYIWHGQESDRAEGSWLEVTVLPGQQRRIEVPPGGYRLTWRHGDTADHKDITVRPGSLWRVEPEIFDPEVASLKGGAPTHDSLDAHVGAALPMLPHATVAPSAGLTYAHRFDDHALHLVVDASADFATSSLEAPATPSRLLVGSAMAGARVEHRPFDWLRLSYGLRLGGVWVGQQAAGTALRDQFAPAAAAVLRFEIPLSPTFYLVPEAQERVALLRLNDGSNVSPWRWQTVFTLGFGVRF